MVPLVSASVAIYAKDFSTECYIYRDSQSELLPQSPFILKSFLSDSGFDVDVITSTDNLDKYDAVIVLSCTKLTTNDLNNIIRFYEKGGGLVLDAREDNPLIHHFDVYKKTYPLEGLDRSSLDTTYVTVKNGVLVNTPIINKSSPIVSGYEKMYYVGEPLAAPSGFNSGFTTESGENVMVWKMDGMKRVAILGCLYCADPLLLTNVVDWAEDGSVDFPDFRIYRKVIPEIVPLGNILVDMISITVDKELNNVTGNYLYNTGNPAYCDFGEPRSEIEPPEPEGDSYKISVKFTYKARGKPGTCSLPPALILLKWKDQTRRVIVDPVEVTVSGKSIAYTVSNIFEENYVLLIGIALGLLLVGAYFAHEGKKRKLIREWEKYKNLIALTKKRRLVGELSEDAYKDLLKTYQEKLQEIEVEMKMMGINPPSTSAGQSTKGRSKRWQPKQKGTK